MKIKGYETQFCDKYWYRLGITRNDVIISFVLSLLYIAYLFVAIQISVKILRKINQQHKFIFISISLSLQLDSILRLLYFLDPAKVFYIALTRSCQTFYLQMQQDFENQIIPFIMNPINYAYFTFFYFIFRLPVYLLICMIYTNLSFQIEPSKYRQKQIFSQKISLYIYLLIFIISLIMIWVMYIERKTIDLFCGCYYYVSTIFEVIAAIHQAVASRDIWNCFKEFSNSNEQLKKIKALIYICSLSILIKFIWVLIISICASDLKKFKIHSCKDEISRNSENYFSYAYIGIIVITELIPKAYVVYFIWNLIDHKWTFSHIKNSFETVNVANGSVQLMTPSYLKEEEVIVVHNSIDTFDNLTRTADLLYPTLKNNEE